MLFLLASFYSFTNIRLMNPEGIQKKTEAESSAHTATKGGENKIPVLGIAAGLTESVKEAQEAEKALEQRPRPGAHRTRTFSRESSRSHSRTARSI